MVFGRSYGRVDVVLMILRGSVNTKKTWVVRVDDDNNIATRFCVK